jgi:hypothetical protein
MKSEKKKDKKRFTRTKNFFKKLPINLARRPITSCVFLLIIAVFLGLIFFYNIYFSTLKKESEEFQKSFVIEEKVYLNVLSVWQKQNRESAEADSKDYVSPFVGGQEQELILTP